MEIMKNLNYYSKASMPSKVINGNIGQFKKTFTVRL